MFLTMSFVVFNLPVIEGAIAELNFMKHENFIYMIIYIQIVL